MPPTLKRDEDAPGQQSVVSCSQGAWPSRVSLGTARGRPFTRPV